MKRRGFFASCAALAAATLLRKVPAAAAAVEPVGLPPVGAPYPRSFPVVTHWYVTYTDEAVNVRTYSSELPTTGVVWTGASA
jgi:hypothetical protein